MRAPWGEVARAKMDGPLGLYRATLHVPRLQARGDAELEVVACDTAGNVSRRPLSLVGGLVVGGELRRRHAALDRRVRPAVRAPQPPRGERRRDGARSDTPSLRASPSRR